MMWLLTAWGGVKRLFGAVVAYPLQSALIASMCLSLWLYNGREDARMNLANARDTIKQMEQVSHDARAAQLAMNKANTDKQTEIAKDADNDQTIRRDIAGRSSRYADGMRSKDYCRKASATPEDRVTQDNNPASADAVVLSRTDFDTLTDNTARLVEVHEWGLALIQADLAVAVD